MLRQVLWGQQATATVNAALGSAQQKAAALRMSASIHHVRFASLRTVQLTFTLYACCHG